MAHLLLNSLGDGRVPCAGGDDLTGAVVTRAAARASVLIYAYPQDPAAPTATESVRVALPPDTTQVRLTRIGAEENNILATWRVMGAPPLPTRDQLEQLRAANRLTAASNVAVQIKDGQASFTVERPGVALLECE
jgi:beta-xylosidase